MPPSRMVGSICGLVILLLASSASIQRASSHEQDSSDGQNRIERVSAHPIASGIRIFEVRLGPDRVAERRTEIGDNMSSRELRSGYLNPRLEDDFHRRTVDPEGRPARYHLHRALLI